MTRRKADKARDEHDHVRTVSRTICRGDKWFFSSREGEHGPFASESQADEALEAYVQLIDLRSENEEPVKSDEG